MLIHRTTRFIAQAEHLAEIHLEESSLDLVEREISYIAVLDLDFDTIAAAIGFTKQALVTVISAAGSSALDLPFLLADSDFQTRQSMSRTRRSTMLCSNRYRT